jgi:hypothetical protein
MFTRAIIDTEDELITAALADMRAAWTAKIAFADVDPATIILDPEDPDYQTLGENALNSYGVLITPVVGITFSGLLATYTLTINCETDRRQHAATCGAYAHSPRYWAQFAMACCKSTTTTALELTPAGLEDGGITENTESWLARLTGQAITAFA